MTDILPCLWFDGVAEEAARFYAGLFPESSVGRVNRSPADCPSGPKGMVLTVEFTLLGKPYLGLNGGPLFKFNEAVSFIVTCKDQAEVDRYWAALSERGEPGPCGWLKDRYGLSWQIVPEAAIDMWRDPDTTRAGRAFEELMKMGKIDLARLEKAFRG